MCYTELVWGDIVVAMSRVGKAGPGRMITNRVSGWGKVMPTPGLSKIEKLQLTGMRDSIDRCKWDAEYAAAMKDRKAIGR